MDKDQNRFDGQPEIDAAQCYTLGRQRAELLDMAGEERIAPNYQPASSQLRQPREDPIEVLFSACVQDM